jgi:hypothetical protein
MYIYINKHKINCVIKATDIAFIEVCKSEDSLIPYLHILYTNDQTINIDLSGIKDAPDLHKKLIQDICNCLEYVKIRGYDMQSIYDENEEE